ncbi:MAG TPA: restriction endonuclease subunit S [Candidatus Angelobacter sp.]|nr:restriction endonuclease subunit S [Candidatus Angelobacter sp.]
MEHHSESTVGELVQTIFTGLSPSKLPPSGEPSSPLFRVINSRDFEHGVIAAPESLEEIELPGPTHSQRYRVEEGDIVIAARGAFKVARVGPEYQGYLAGPNLIVVRPSQLINSWLLYAFFTHPVTQSEIRKQSVGTTVAAISGATISRLRIAIPKLEMQQKIGRLIETAHMQFVLGREIADVRWKLAQEIVGKEFLS